MRLPRLDNIVWGQKHGALQETKFPHRTLPDLSPRARSRPSGLTRMERTPLRDSLLESRIFFKAEDTKDTIPMSEGYDRKQRLSKRRTAKKT